MTDTGTVSRAISVLRLLARSHEPLRVKTVADELGLPMSTSHRFLDLLLEGGFVQKDKFHRYSAGVELKLLSGAIADKPSPVKTLTPLLEELASSTGQATVISLFAAPRRIMFYAALFGTPSGYNIELRSQQPVAWGASGLSMLAFLPDMEQRRIITASEPSPVTGAMLDKASTHDRLRDIRADGFAVSRGEKIRGVVGVGAAIFEADSVVGSICVAVPERRFKNAMLASLGPAVVRVAQKASIELERTAKPFASEPFTRRASRNELRADTN